MSKLAIYIPNFKPNHLKLGDPHDKFKNFNVKFFYPKII